MNAFQYGVLGQTAAELRVPHWIDADGNKTDPVTLAAQGDSVKILYCFQSWCPGCHSSGFPTLQALRKHYDGAIAKGDLSIMVAQTVFEGHSSNPASKLREMQKRYDLDVPFAHDDARPRPTIMTDYRTGGTPWMIIMDRDNKVIYNDFHIDPRTAVSLIDGALKNRHHKPNPETFAVTDNESANQYEVDLNNGHTAVLKYRTEGNVRYLEHAEVPAALRGQKYGEVLMESALEKIESQKFKVVPVCSYVQAFFRRYKRWAHLLA